ncbi:serine threonine kinase [Fusarium denticulatum]|uniref:Serine threonine kinase n=1 Tax=Fusarium denticulatum TaxID=48507 RepID=A0A8H5TKN3_9HYPO|nr:serine threonine kinase [Fusarium denticulatum]
MGGREVQHDALSVWEGSPDRILLERMEKEYREYLRVLQESHRTTNSADEQHRKTDEALKLSHTKHHSATISSGIDVAGNSGRRSEIPALGGHGFEAASCNSGHIFPKAKILEYDQQKISDSDRTRVGVGNPIEGLQRDAGTESQVKLFEKVEQPPFYDFLESARAVFDDMKVFNSGGSADVFQALIQTHGHMTHDSYSYAVKKLRHGSLNDYLRERNAYLRVNSHPHIVPLLASYRMQGKYHLVFPLADHDLATYWYNKPKPPKDKRSLGWFVNQMKGLADALLTVHGQNSQGKNWYGIHGDIKPANILCFRGDNHRTCFALADFGSSYFRTPEEEAFPNGLKHTPVYRAPEIDMKRGITQAYDIWSLGCVFAEAIAWFCDGKIGVSKLARVRLDKEDNCPNRDAFFRLTKRRGGRSVLSAQLKPEIQRFLKSFPEHHRSSQFTTDIIHLVIKGMLKVDLHERMTSQEVSDALGQMSEKLDRHPSYSQPHGTNDMKTVHATQNSRQRLNETVDATHYSNVSTQSDAGTQISSKPRFACPFHKAGILVADSRGSCLGPGWTDLTRVREHLFRCHVPKKYRGKHICRRCDTSFETDELLLAHQHQETPCPRKDPEAIRGMLSREQAAQLRSLKRKSSKESEEDRWFDIYRIAFPSFNQMLENISPYHESNTTSLGALNSTSSNRISQYKDYLRNRDAEEYAAKLAANGIIITLDAASKILELQVKELGTFDETMRGPV